MSTETVIRIAKAFHATYERLAPEHDYRTREASAKPWDDLPVANKRLMVQTVDHLLLDGTIDAGPALTAGHKQGPADV